MNSRDMEKLVGKLRHAGEYDAADAIDYLRFALADIASGMGSPQQIAEAALDGTFTPFHPKQDS